MSIMFANGSNVFNGNVKIFISDDRLIYKIYPYQIINDKEYKPRLKKENETTLNKKEINLFNKKLKLVGYALCNEWQYFFTGTIDQLTYPAASFEDAAHLISEQFHKMTKLYGSSKVQYLFILEQHKNGKYHAHGLCNIPYELVNPFPSYIRWHNGKIQVIKPSKSKFIQYGINQNFYQIGLNTISPIRSRLNVTDYVTKYMVKSMAEGSKYSKTIFHSKGLDNFRIEYGGFIGDDFPSLESIAAENYAITDSIYNYDIKFYGNVREITIDLV